MDELKGRRIRSGQLSVPELVFPPPDKDTFEMIDNPHIIINGKTAFSVAIMTFTIRWEFLGMLN